jgi:hypothetical protein
MHFPDVRIEGNLRTILLITILVRALPILSIDLLDFVGLALLAAPFLFFQLILQLFHHPYQVRSFLLELSHLFLKMDVDPIGLLCKIV